jgi:hypothetical protein
LDQITYGAFGNILSQTNSSNAPLKTLALVRKLAVPVLQVNIAKKQVNVAGSCVAGDSEKSTL